MPRALHHITLWLRAILLLCLPGVIPLSALGQARLTKVGWQLDPNLSDDFDDATPLTAKWALLEDEHPVQTSFSAYSSWNNVTKGNGWATFHTIKQACFDPATNVHYFYSTASLINKYDEYPGLSADKKPGGLLYGMYEIRCKLPRKAGQYPCFWLCGQVAWPPEIDVFEHNGRTPTMFFSTVHYRNPAYNGQNPRDIAAGANYWLPYALADDFHTWTMVWTPTKITWFYDGLEVQSDEVAQHIPGSATWGVNATNRWELYHWEQMKMIFGTGLNYPDSTEEAFGDFIVDYVHVYKPAGLLAYTHPQQRQNAVDYYDKQLVPAYQQAVYQTGGDYSNWLRLLPTIETEALGYWPSVCKLPAVNQFSLEQGASCWPGQ